MQYDEMEPQPDLRDLIRCYWFLRDPDAVAGRPPDPALPDGSPELIFNLAAPFRARTAHGTMRPQPPTFLVGQITRPFAVTPTGPVDLVAVRFAPAGAALLGRRMAPLTNTWVATTRLPSGRALATLAAPLSVASDRAARSAILDGAMTAIRAAGPLPDPAVAVAVDAIVSSHGALPMARVLEAAAMSERTLQRRFAAQVGVSPKLLARIRRFQRVFSAWRREPASWARVAVSCGYFDQSHLVRDFRDFSGSAPAAFLATAPEFTRFFLGRDASRTVPAD